MPEMVFNKISQTSYFHVFMKSLLGLMWKPNYENIPPALQFNCDLHKTEPSFACIFSQCPPVFVPWRRMDDHCFMGTFLGAPLSLHHLHSSSLTGECPTLSTWIQEIPPLGTETQQNHWITTQVNCKAALAAHPRRTSSVICPRHRGLDPCLLLSHPRVSLLLWQHSTEAVQVLE